MKQSNKKTVAKKQPLPTLFTYRFEKGDPDVAMMMEKARLVIKTFGVNKKEDLKFTYGQLLYLSSLDLDFRELIDESIENVQSNILRWQMDAEDIALKE